MAGHKVVLAIIAFILITRTTEACQRVSSPCGEGRCCHLVFNLRLLSYSFCRNRNRNDDRCAQNDYCLIDSDCDGNDKCEGATAIKWGRCKGTLNPCLNPKK